MRRVPRWSVLLGGVLVALVAMAAVLAAGACSSSSPTAPAVVDSGQPPPPPMDSSPPPPTPPLCGPANVSAFTPTWFPPVGPGTGACTDAQITGLINGCFGANGTSMACGAWYADPNNQACFACTEGPVTATTWAPFVYARNPGETDYVNIGGCVALAQPAALACAKSIQAEFTCEMAACLTACPIPGGPDAGVADGGAVKAAVAALYSCYNYVDQTSCKTYVDAVSACATPMFNSGPTAFCYAANKDTTALRQLFTLACGSSAPADGGADAPGSDAPSDAPADAGGG
jgi:hypothetical protein